jgi:hypothetical protein
VADLPTNAELAASLPTGFASLELADNRIVLPQLMSVDFEVFMDTIFAGAVGKRSGIGTSVETYRGYADDFRFQATFDADSNTTDLVYEEP